jgi:hypothetical protein
MIYYCKGPIQFVSYLYDQNVYQAIALIFESKAGGYPKWSLPLALHSELLCSSSKILV